MIVRQPAVDTRSEKPYMGIRARVPMRGMSGAVTLLFKEMATWVKRHAIEPAGPPFLRFHVIDMAGEMDIEVGMPVAAAAPGDERVCAGTLPAGRYASLIYVRSGIAGNRALIEWAESNHLAWDRWEDARGDAFRSRYETYLTDPKIEPHKTKWEVEVAIKLADNAV